MIGDLRRFCMMIETVQDEYNREGRRGYGG